MFNAYLNPGTIEVHTTEKRAPTDASVQLLREMEQAARAEIIKAVRVESTLVDAVLHKNHDFINCQDQYACLFKVNGQRLRADFLVHPGASQEDVAVGIRDAIAKEIANVIAADVLKAAKRL